MYYMVASSQFLTSGLVSAVLFSKVFWKWLALAWFSGHPAGFLPQVGLEIMGSQFLSSCLIHYTKLALICVLYNHRWNATSPIYSIAQRHSCMSRSLARLCVCLILQARELLLSSSQMPINIRDPFSIKIILQLSVPVSDLWLHH